MGEDPNLLACGSEFQQFYQNLDNTNFALFNAIRENMEQGNVTTALGINEFIVPANQLEANWKLVNTIFLNTWAVGIMEFTLSQYAELHNIACLSTLEGGPAVADARLMLGLGDMDDFECGLRIGSSKDLEQLDVRIYPNPVSDVVTVESDIEVKYLTIMDISGRVIKSFFISGRESKITIPVKDFDKGIYIVCIGNELEKTTKKLIVD